MALLLLQQGLFLFNNNLKCKYQSSSISNTQGIQVSVFFQGREFNKASFQPSGSLLILTLPRAVINLCFLLIYQYIIMQTGCENKENHELCNVASPNVLE